MEELTFKTFKDSFTSTQVAILISAAKHSVAPNHAENLNRLQAQGPEEFKEAQFHLKSWGLINARYELTARGRRLVNDGVYDTSLKGD